MKIKQKRTLFLLRFANTIILSPSLFLSSTSGINMTGPFITHSFFHLYYITLAMMHDRISRSALNKNQGRKKFNLIWAARASKRIKNHLHGSLTICSRVCNILNYIKTTRFLALGNKAWNHRHAVICFLSHSAPLLMHMKLPQLQNMS